MEDGWNIWISVEITSKTNTADQKGKIAIHNFLHPSNQKECQSTVVVMNEVIRQADNDFKGFLHRVEDGSLNEKDVDFIHSCCLDRLSQIEREQFKSAINLV